VPPRYVYWTIIVDGQPTAFRAASLEDIMPTFNRLKEKHPTAELKWFQHGKLWPSRHDAQDFMRVRGDRGRERDPRQTTGDQANPRPERAWNAKPEWKTRKSFSPAAAKPTARQAPGDEPAWVPKGELSPKPQPPSRSFDEKPSFAEAPADKPARQAASEKRAFAKATEGKPEWKPKGSFVSAARRDDGKPAWKPKGAAARGSFDDRDDRPAGQARGSKPPEWKPKGTFKPKEAGHSAGWGEKPGWKSKSDRDETSSWKPKGDAGGKPEWKPKGTFKPKETGHRPSARDEARSSFRPKSYTPRDESAGPSRSAKARDQKLEWKPASARGSARQAPESRPSGPNAGFARSDPDAPKRKWVPKAEYKKSLGIEVKRDDKWRPGGEHVDPKQKYKDAKKAKWTRLKATIRARSSKPRKPKDE